MSTESSDQSCCSPQIKGTKSRLKHREMVSEEKSLSLEWVQSLYQQGNPETYSGEALEYIGMPVSGICTGQVYLGGDGQLWHWDVFKAYGGGWDEPIDPRGYHYPDPVKPKSPMAQGFAIHIHGDLGMGHVRNLDQSGFDEVAFTGRYPIGEVSYKDAKCPIELGLQAYSPFIPLDADDSGLPATIVEYTLENISEAAVTVEIFGWLENKVCRYNDQQEEGIRRNKILASENSMLLKCSAIDSETSNVEKLEGYGDMSLILLDRQASDVAIAGIKNGRRDNGKIAQQAVEALNASRLAAESGTSEPVADQEFGSINVGAIGRQLTLQPGQSETVKFAVTWFFPKYSGGYVFHSTLEDLPNLNDIRRFYASRFDSSAAVASYVRDNYTKLAQATKMWVDTWYDSTLPVWLLNRVFANVATLATQTCHRFDNGRFYGWEGVDCCPGTCQHVWQYAQGMARVFPQLERYVREHVDYSIAYYEDGSIDYRAEAGSGAGEEGDVHMTSENESQAFFAADGQLGTILRIYREHSMSADASFLQRLWPKVKKSLQFIESLDANKDGLLEQAQFNTLDTSWYGEIPWISSLYLAALSAGKAMATEMGDAEFHEYCDNILTKGKRNFEQRLFNGEYFVHQADPGHRKDMDLTQGCYIDQLLGQSFALQYGLEPIISKEKAQSALGALWKYNFTTDVGRYRDAFTDVSGGRWYAMPGESGLLMCTWPQDDCERSEYEQKILGLDVTSEGYLNECMSGFEYQVASHMIAEGLVEKGLAITKSIHDRYHPSKRNPYNEVECSDHYSRAMSSYGVFLNLCGFQYHGPKGEICFLPKISSENFKTAFITAEGWGSFQQTLENREQTASLMVKHGQLKLKSIRLSRLLDSHKVAVRVSIDGTYVSTSHNLDGVELMLQLSYAIVIAAAETLEIKIFPCD